MTRFIIRGRFFVVVSFVLSACVPKSDLDVAKLEVERLHGRVVTLEKQNEALRTQIVAAVNQNAALKTQVGQVTVGLAAAREQLARKPAMPVAVSLRPATSGSGYVAVLSTTTKQDFPVLITVKSAALGTSKQFSVQLNASQASELGSTEGAAIDRDDELLIENTNFEPVSFKFPRK